MAGCCFANDVQDVHDANIQKSNRCTDFTFLLIFIIFWIGLAFIGIYAFIVGSPLRLIHGTDSFGNVCGHYNDPVGSFPFSGMDMRDRKYLFYLNPEDLDNSIKICVAKCPRELLLDLGQIYLFYQRNHSSLCRYDFDFTNAESIRAQRTGPSYQPYIATNRDGNSYNYNRNIFTGVLSNDTGLCPKTPVYPTSSLVYRCVPKMVISQGMAWGHSFYDFMSGYVPLKKVFSDIVNAYQEMVIMGIVALFSAFASAFVIHFVANIASWLILVVISVLLLVFTTLLWWAYLDMAYDLKSFRLYGNGNYTILPEDYENESIVLAIAIICTIITVVILYAASTLRSHVRFVVALFHETSSCIRSMPLLLIQPLWTLFALLSFFLVWLLTMMALSTANHASRESRVLQSQVQSTGESSQIAHLASFTLISFDHSLSWIHYMWWYLVIALIWISEFILSCQQMVIAGAVSSWYFTRDRETLDSPISKSISELFCRHIGSVALGSFLITLFKLPRLIIQQITARLRQHEESRLARSALQACACCLWMVERFLAYLSRNAYTVVVIERTDFCTSARLAFQALLSNAIRVAAINSIGDFILFLGKLGCAVLTAIVGIFLVRGNPSLHYWSVPVIMMSIFAFWVAHCLLSVYEMVIDSMFLCFCQDMNRHDGSPGNEYYAPESLLRFLSEDQEQNMTQLSSQNQEGKQKNQPQEENDYSTVI